LASYLDTIRRKRKHSLGIIQRNYFRKQVSEDPPDEVSGEEGGVDVPFENRVYYRPHQAEGYDPGIQWRRGEDGEYYYDGREGTRSLEDDLYRVYMSRYESDAVDEEFRAMLVEDMAFDSELAARNGPSPYIMARIYQRAVGGGGEGARVLLNSMALRAAQAHQQGLTQRPPRFSHEVAWIERWMEMAQLLRANASQEMRDRGFYSTDDVRDIVEEGPEVGGVDQDDEFDTRPSDTDVPALLERASVWSGREWEEDEGEPNRTAGEENLETARTLGGVLLYNNDDGFYYEFDSDGTTGGRYTFEETLGTSQRVVGEPAALEEQRAENQRQSGPGAAIVYDDDTGLYSEYDSEGEIVGEEWLFEDTLNTSLPIIGEPLDLTAEREAIQRQSERSGYDAELNEDDTEDTWSMGYEEVQEPPTIVSDLSPEAHRAALNLAGVPPEVYERLSAWGKESLAGTRVILGNKRLWEDTPTIFILDGGGMVVPAEKITVVDGEWERVVDKNAGKPIRASRRKSNGLIDWRQGISRKMYVEALSAVKAHNRDVSSGQEQGPLLELPKILSFAEWMEERDKTFQSQLEVAEKKQAAHYETRKSYYPERVAEFSNRGTGVVGEVDSNWANENGSDIGDRYVKHDGFLRDTRIPEHAKLLPPTSLDNIDYPEEYRSVTTTGPYVSTADFQQIIYEWFNLKLEDLATKNPVSWDNQKNWFFGHSTAWSAARAIAKATGHISKESWDNLDDNHPIISVDRNGEVGAALLFEGRGGEHWHVDSAGTNAKNFPIYPFKEIHNSLSRAVDEETAPDRKKELRNLLRSWQIYGRRMPSGNPSGGYDTKHAMYVFAEFSRQVVLDDDVKEITTSPLSDYVGEMYSKMGFVNGSTAHRLNILWNLAYLWPDMMPRDVDGSMITKGFIDNSEKYGIITTDNSLNRIQNMLDGLMKESTRSPITDAEFDAEDYREAEIHRKELEMTRAEYSKFLLQFNFMLAGTGQPEEDEDKS